MLMVLKRRRNSKGKTTSTNPWLCLPLKGVQRRLLGMHYKNISINKCVCVENLGEENPTQPMSLCF